MIHGNTRLKLLSVRRRRPVNIPVVLAGHHDLDTGIFENIPNLARDLQRDVLFSKAANADSPRVRTSMPRIDDNRAPFQA